MDFRVLGPFDVVTDGVSLRLGGPKQRVVLAALVVRANQVVSADALIGAVWGDDPPMSALGVLRAYVSRLRGALSVNGHGVHLHHRSPGYVLTVDAERIDVHRFEELARRGRRELEAGDPRAASAALRGALDLWRGDALADLTGVEHVRAIAARLDEMRLLTAEDLVDVELGLGRHAMLIGELEELTARHPFRERLWAQLIVALYRSGRQADALSAYRTVRSTLAEQLGIAPGPRLRALEAAVLAQADDLAWHPSTADGRHEHSDDAVYVTARVNTAEPRAVVAAHVEAAQGALATQAFQDAFNRFRAATELIDGAAGVDAEVAYAAWLGLATAAAAAGGWADHQRTGYLRAASIAREHGWPQRLAIAAIGWAAYSSAAHSPRPETGNVHDALATEHMLDEALARLSDGLPVERSLVLAVKVVHAVMLDRGDEARALLASLESLATSSGDATASAIALMARCWALLGTPRLRELEDCVERALGAPVAPDVRGLVHGYVLPVLAVPALRRGDRRAFEAARARVAAHAGTRRPTHLKACVRMWDAAVSLASGRLTAATSLAATLPGTGDWSVWDKVSALQLSVASALRGDHSVVRSRLAQVVSSTPPVPMFGAALAYLDLRHGRVAEARQRIEALRPAVRDGDLGLNASITLTCLSDVAARLHMADLAEDLLAVLTEYSGQMLVSYTGATIDGAADRAVGQVLVAQGRLDEAIEAFVAAQELEQGFGAEALAIRSAYRQARARYKRRGRGDDEAAQRLLRWASSRAGRLGMPGLEQECLAALP